MTPYVETTSVCPSVCDLQVSEKRVTNTVAANVIVASMCSCYVRSRWHTSDVQVVTVEV